MTAHQTPPGAGVLDNDFPTRTVRTGAATYRAHHVDREAWYFDNSGGGRFDLADDRGTCYTATNVETAVREKLRDELLAARTIPRSLAESFRVSELRAPLPYRCAAVNDDRAARYGVVRELVTMADYTIPQAWASALHDRGYDGLFYASAYTTGTASAYAFFGTAGAPPHSAGYTAACAAEGMEACESIGVAVEDPPLLRAIGIIA